MPTLRPLPSALARFQKPKPPAPKKIATLTPRAQLETLLAKKDSYKSMRPLQQKLLQALIFGGEDAFLREAEKHNLNHKDCSRQTRDGEVLIARINEDLLLSIRDHYTRFRRSSPEIARLIDDARRLQN